ncbi:MAG: FAD-dependent oxidoreductase [Bacteroidota bacterium]
MKKVIVIGGGVVGLCSAYFLREAGHEVLLLEKGKLKDGASFGNAGYICPSHAVPLAQPGMIAKGIRWMFNPESPFYIQPKLDRDLISWGWKFYKHSTEQHVNKTKTVLRDLGWLSKKLYQEFSKKKDFEFAFEEKGLISLHQTPKGAQAQKHEAELLNKIGIDVKELSADEVQAMDPQIKMNATGAIYFTGDAHLYPHLFMQCLRDDLNKNDRSEIHFETEVQQLVFKNRKIKKAITSRGAFSADEYVICSGAWSPGLVKNLKINIPIQAAKGYNVTVKNPKVKPSHPYLLSEAKVAVTPMADDLRFAGTLEIAGINHRINPRRVQGILNAIPNFFPEFDLSDFKKAEPWAGLRPCSPDGMPYLGRLKYYDNLTVAAGHAMVGMSLGAGTGKIVAQIISDEQPEVMDTSLNPDRFN